jgi:hypothetical protein
MHDDDKPTTSPAQDDYTAFAAACRRQLAAIGERQLAKASAVEVHHFVNAMQAVYAFEVSALAFDRKCEANGNCPGH